MNSYVNEFAKSNLTRLVARRGDFKCSHYIAKYVPNYDLVRSNRVTLDLCFYLKSGSRRCIQKCDASAGIVALGVAYRR